MAVQALETENIEDLMDHCHRARMAYSVTCAVKPKPKTLDEHRNRVDCYACRARVETSDGLVVETEALPSAAQALNRAVSLARGNVRRR